MNSINRIICSLTGRELELDDGDLVAIKNTLELAKERIWLAQDMPMGEGLDRFRELLDVDEIDRSIASVQRVNSVVNRINHATQKENTEHQET